MFLCDEKTLKDVGRIKRRSTKLLFWNLKSSWVFTPIVTTTNIPRSLSACSFMDATQHYLAFSKPHSTALAIYFSITANYYYNPKILRKAKSIVSFLFTDQPLNSSLLAIVFDSAFHWWWIFSLFSSLLY